MPPSAIVMGHSFVVSLRDHLRRGGHVLSPAATAKVLRVDSQVSAVSLAGERGASACSGFQPPVILLKRINPEIVILNIGSNDLAAGVTATRVATTVIGIAHQLVSDHGVKLVAICSVLPRSGNLQITDQAFTAAMKTCNTIMYQMCKEFDHLVYWSHNGFWAKSIDIWSRDNIHPNSHWGRKAYKKSIRQCLFLCSTILKQDRNRAVSAINM